MTNNSTGREEKLLNPISGFIILIPAIILFIASVWGFILAIIDFVDNGYSHSALTLLLAMIGYWILILPLAIGGLKIVNPNEAAVYVLFGRYYGTIAKPGFFFINPFCSMTNPTTPPPDWTTWNIPNRKVSLRAITLSNERQKINDREGNPIEIGVVVIWRITNATKAVFEVDNYSAYVSTQSDAAIRNVARQYPYDISEDGEETSLRGSSSKVAEELRTELQSRVEFAGIEIIETRIAHLAYAPEIAAAMLQRQQAKAVIDAKQKIVEGAVGMVEMALRKLSEGNIVDLDDERKATMVSNLLVVLCGNRDAQPIVNSGSLY